MLLLKIWRKRVSFYSKYIRLRGSLGILNLFMEKNQRIVRYGIRKKRFHYWTVKKSPTNSVQNVHLHVFGWQIGFDHYVYFVDFVFVLVGLWYYYIIFPITFFFGLALSPFVICIYISLKFYYQLIIKIWYFITLYNILFLIR